MQSTTDVVVVSKDTDVLILMVWAYSKFEVKHKWYLKYDYDTFADIKLIVEYLGETVCDHFPAMHAITGCDTTSYFYRISKIKVLQNMQKQIEFCELISCLGETLNLSDSNIERVKEFVRTIVYNGRPSESLVQTRVRLYQSLKQKLSMCIPPDPDSFKQCIKHAHYQTFKWVHCKEKMIAAINFESNSWSWCSDEEIVKPVWFVNSQLPASCDKKRKRGNINASTLKKLKRQRSELNLFISNNVIADALQISESDVEESDSLQGKKLMDLLYDADDEIDIELVPEVMK